MVHGVLRDGASVTDTDLIIARIEAKDDADRDRHVEIVRRLEVVEQLQHATNGRLRKVELWRHGLEAVAQKHGWRWPAVISIAAAVVSGTVVALVAALIAQGG